MAVACCSTLENQVRMSGVWVSSCCRYGIRVSSSAIAATTANPAAPHTRNKGDARTPKTPLIRNVVDEQDPHRAAVVRRRDGAEPLLPGRVPDLELDRSVR